jgi:hypothetical protein
MMAFAYSVAQRIITLLKSTRTMWMWRLKDTGPASRMTFSPPLTIERIAMDETLQLVKQLEVNTAMSKLSRALDKVPDGEAKFDKIVEEVAEQAIFAKPLKERLDLFKEAMGEEHYAALCNNPSFNDMFKEWMGVKAQESLQSIFDKIKEVFSELEGEDAVSETDIATVVNSMLN